MSSGLSMKGFPLRVGLDHLIRQDLEVQTELMPELILPLLGESPGAMTRHRSTSPGSSAPCRTVRP